MIHKKVAMLGAFAVGKTSLVQRFVTGIFAERYSTTVGVRIDKREVMVQDRPMLLMLWDLQGEDDSHQVRMTHVRGSAGLFLVADCTRPHTLDTALRLGQQAAAAFGPVPTILLLNKSDLRSGWLVAEERLAELQRSGLVIVEASARTGDQVEGAFDTLALRMLAG